MLGWSLNGKRWKEDRDRVNKWKRIKRRRRREKKWKSFDSLIYQSNNVYFDVIRKFSPRYHYSFVQLLLLFDHIQFLVLTLSFRYTHQISCEFSSIGRFSLLACCLWPHFSFKLHICSTLFTQSTRWLSILFTCVFNFDMYKYLYMNGCIYVAKYFSTVYARRKCLNYAADKQTHQWL